MAPSEAEDIRVLRQIARVISRLETVTTASRRAAHSAEAACFELLETVETGAGWNGALSSVVESALASRRTVLQATASTIVSMSKDEFLSLVNISDIENRIQQRIEGSTGRHATVGLVAAAAPACDSAVTDRPTRDRITLDIRLADDADDAERCMCSLAIWTRDGSLEMVPARIPWACATDHAILVAIREALVAALAESTPLRVPLSGNPLFTMLNDAAVLGVGLGPGASFFLGAPRRSGRGWPGTDGSGALELRIGWQDLLTPVATATSAAVRRLTQEAVNDIAKRFTFLAFTVEDVATSLRDFAGSTTVSATLVSIVQIAMTWQAQSTWVIRLSLFSPLELSAAISDGAFVRMTSKVSGERTKAVEVSTRVCVVNFQVVPCASVDQGIVRKWENDWKILIERELKNFGASQSQQEVVPIPLPRVAERVSLTPLGLYVKCAPPRA